MSFILGIDTGGTFTDVVIWCSDSNTVLQKAKTFTTPGNLTAGIDSCMGSLDPDKLSAISSIHLSTTLTVNSILEDKFSKIGLLLIGKHTSEKLPIHQKYEIINYDFPHHQKCFKINASDLQDIRELFCEECPVVMVSACDKNPAPVEKAAAAALRGPLDLEVLCCSTFSSKNDLYERTLDAATIVGLRPAIDKWADSIKQVMKYYGIDAPMRVLTGYGTLIPLEEAILHPLDMMMSGPAASFIGSTCLTNEKDYLLLDMGGTSLDITKVENGVTRFSQNETTVGNFRYHTNTLDLQCFSTGGDSKIKFNSLGDIIVGPQRVLPLCVLGAAYPHLIAELQAFHLPQEYDLCTAEETDCYFVEHPCPMLHLGEEERKIVELLMDNPHSLLFLANYFDKDPDALHMDQLVEKGYVRCASLTPTDILHAEGTFEKWDTSISKIGVQILAKKKGCNMNTLITDVKGIITNQLAFCCMQSIAGFEKKRFLFSDSDATMYLIEKYLNRDTGLLNSDFTIQKPIVGVGAPAKAWLPAVAEKLNTKIVIPDDADVASAVGAAAGKVVSW